MANEKNRLKIKTDKEPTIAAAITKLELTIASCTLVKRSPATKAATTYAVTTEKYMVSAARKLPIIEAA
ncbi:MAG: hypothetical protein V7711_06000 [Pseudomonadales bacterium]